MLSYSYLREIQKKELESGALVQLGDDFYSKVSDFIEQKKKDAMESKSIISIREYENTTKIILAIQGRREEKILLMALRNEKSDIGLTKEEKKMFADVRETLSGYRGSVGEITNVSEKKSTMKKVKMNDHVSEYKGTDNNVYGPFSKDNEYIIPREEAEWLVKEKMATLVV